MLFDQLNEVTDYIERHIEEAIKTADIAYEVGLDESMLRKVFPLATGLTITQYIRYRKMTLAGKDMIQSDLRIIDIAMKYGYDSPAAFSRAFQKFHHLTPSIARQTAGALKLFPKAFFTKPEKIQEINYEITTTTSCDLWGIEIMSDLENIHADAPKLFQQVRLDYTDLPHPDFGALDYHAGRNANDGYAYSVLWKNALIRTPGSEKFINKRIHGGRWIKMLVGSQSAEDIQKTMLAFYDTFLPTCPYRLRPDPELEHYHDGITELMVPIY